MSLHKLSLVLGKKKESLLWLQVLTYNTDRRAVFKINFGEKVKLSKLNNGYSMKDPHGRKGQIYVGPKRLRMILW